MHRVLIVSLILMGQYLGTAGVSAAPIANITSPTNGASISQDAFTFSATASDPTGIEWVMFHIQSYGTGTNPGWQMATNENWCYYYDTTYPYSVTYDWSHLYKGLYTITIGARNNAGEYRGYPAYVITKAMGTISPTAAQITFPSDGSTITQDTFTFSATANDPDKIEWVRFYIQSYGTGTNPGWQMAPDKNWCYYDDTTYPYDVTYDWSHLQNGSYQITSWTRDNAGKIFTTSTYNITKSVNTLPTAAFTMMTTTGTIGTTFYVDASASQDPEGAITVSWQWESGGEWINGTTTRTASHQYSTPGTKTITLLVTDMHNATATATWWVVITPITGSISVVSTPADASVLLDGVDKGTITPIILTSIIPGTHTIKLTKDGYYDWTGTVTVAVGSTTYTYAALIGSNTGNGTATAENYFMQPKWGSEGSGDGQFICLRGVAVDSYGNVFIADYHNHRIQKFTPDGTFITKWGSNGSGDGQFSSPLDVAVDSYGNVFVADDNNHRIQKFTPDGTFITKWGSNGSGDGQFICSRGVAVDSYGNVFVVDYGNHRIQKFTPDGTFITKWGSQGSGDGQFYQPWGVAVDSYGNVFVADCGNRRIQKFTPDGTFITKWGSQGSGDGQFSEPCDIAVDSSVNVFVVDSSHHRIQKFTPDGTFITKWGSYGSEDGQFKYPYGIAVDSSGNVFVADLENYRIQKFKAYPAGWLAGKVTSSADNKEINGAMVEAFNNEAVRVATTTDTNGSYCLFVPAGSCTVRVAASGYSIDEHIVMAIENATATVSSSLVAGTLRKGIISTSTTWTLSNSPYIIGSSTLVEAGVTLTIEPGVVVKFASGTFIRINGCLKAIGTPDNRIVFTSDKAPCSAGDWQYIEFTASSANGGSAISYCEIKYAQHGLYLNVGLPEEISNNIISDNSNYGIYANNLSSDAIISGNIIRDNSSYGIYSCNGKGISVSGNTIGRNNGGIYTNTSSQILDNYITDNGSYGIYQSGGTLNIYGNTVTTHTTAAGLYLQCGTVSQNKIIGNKTGLQLAGKVSVVRNTVSNNNWGIWTDTNSLYDISQNNLCQNTTYDFYNNSSGSIPISGNWWGTTATASIDEKIFDYYDNFDKGKVSYALIKNSEVEWWKDLTPPICKPSTPIDTGTYSTTTFTFSWDKGNAADPETGIGGYRLQVKAVKETTTETILDGNVGNILSYTIVNATNSLTYYARVKAKNGYGIEAEDVFWSDWSDGITVQYGSLTITPTPSGARIYLDGNDTGSPTTHVPAGTHTIKLTLSGYQDWYGTVTVTDGSTTYIYATLTQGSVTVYNATETLIGTYTTIQAGINACPTGGTVSVAAGTYTENINFLGKAITVKSVHGHASTIIDGNMKGSVVTFGSDEGSTSVLDGFTIINGQSNNGGGGIYCGTSSPTITNCTISNNSVGNCSGGIACYFFSSPTITNCTISNNSVGNNGGGISCQSSCSPTITNCTISDNSAGNNGGGIFCYSSSPTITNCTISNNSATYRSGGIFCQSSSPTVVNSIFWNDSPQEIYLFSGGSITITYSNIKDGWAGIGNINTDPLFVGGGDYHLGTASPCINKGSNTAPSIPSIDKDGNPRITGDTVDMGAYEYQGTSTPPIIIPTNLPIGQVGILYSQTLTAIHGTPPYYWSVISGTLSTGLSLGTSTGVISGIPVTVRTSNFIVQLVDSSFPAQTATRTFSLRITALPIEITRITPKTGVDTSTITVTIVGYSFQEGAKAKLSRQNQADIYGTNTQVANSTITTTFDLTNAKSGKWDVIVTNPDSQVGTLTNAFMVTMDRGKPGTVTKGGITVIIPPGAFLQNYCPSVNLDPLNTPEKITPTAIAAVNKKENVHKCIPDLMFEINVYDDEQLIGTNSLPCSPTIIISYPDIDQDGVVDGTSIKEKGLSIFTLNEDDVKWERLIDSKVNSASNTVSASTPHFSVFVLMGTPTANQPPVATFTVTPDTGTITTTFMVDASASQDPEGTIAVSWQWEDGGAWAEGTPTDTASHQYSTKGTKTISLRVKDSEGVTDTTTRQVTIVNSPPTAGNLNISPSSPIQADNLVGTYIYSDVDGDTEIDSQIRWFCNGSYTGIYDGTRIIPATATRKGQEWYFTIRPCDEEDFGQIADSSPVTIGNTPPAANAGSNCTVLVNTPVTLDGSKSLDADQDTLAYHWQQFSGPERVSLSGTTTSKPTFIPTIAGDYSFKLVVNDGSTDSISAAVEVTVVIGTSGGIWKREGNAGQVVFPPDAVSGTVAVTIKLEDEITGVINATHLPGTIREFIMTPGIALNKPITIQIPYTATTGSDENKFQIYRLEGKEWILVDDGGINRVDRAKKVIMAEVSHLSIFCIAETKDLPEEFVVFVYPNPARNKPKATFRWYLPEDYSVIISIYDLNGDMVTTLEGHGRPDGVCFEQDWELQDVASGVYIYVFEGGGKRVVDKVMVVK